MRNSIRQDLRAPALSGAPCAQIAHEEDLDMRTNFDFSPYRRSTVGFDRLFDLLESTARSESADGYPPFDIERESEDSYQITLAVAGFRPEEIEIVAQNNQLTVAGPQERGEGRGSLSVSRHRDAGVRAPLPARRLRSGAARQLRQWPAPDRAQARGSRGNEAAQDRDRRHRRERSDRGAAGRPSRRLMDAEAVGPTLGPAALALGRQHLV